MLNSSQYSLTCRVECSPLCEINWLRNGELINPNATGEYDISSRVIPEEVHLNNLVSIISTLIWKMDNIELDRHSDNANYTCASTANSIGPGVESHTQFFVECE